MKQLEYYVKSLDSGLLKNISGLNGKLIDLVKSGKYVGDETKLSYDFAKEKGHQYYLNTKQRTLKVLQALFLINPPLYRKVVSSDKWNCRRKYIAAAGLMEAGRRDLAWKPLIQAYRLAVECDYTEIAFNAARNLMRSSGFKRKEKDVEFYKIKAQKHFKDLEAELKMQEFTCKFGLLISKNKDLPFDELYKDLDALAKLKCNTTKFIFSYYYRRLLLDLKKGSYALAKLSAEGAIQSLNGRRGLTKTHLEIIYRNKAIAQIALKDPRGANQSLKKAELNGVEKSLNWHAVQYTKAINFLHSKNYKKAHELYRQFRKNKYDVIAELWLVVGAYLYFLREIGSFKAPFERFKIGRYLNEASILNHDKKGANVNILIGELLVYMVSNRTKFIERVEAANQYSYRYLTDEKSKRTKWFIRLLCKVPKADFNFPKLLKKADSLIDKLNEQPIGLGDNMNVEIIPYDHIIELMKESKVLQLTTE